MIPFVQSVRRRRGVFKLPDDLDNKYEFVTLAGLRAEQLQAVARPRVDAEGRRATVVAQEEVALGLVNAWDANAPPPEVVEVVEVEE
jgi:DNA-directed RNA polymerase subunit K/omega